MEATGASGAMFLGQTEQARKVGAFLVSRNRYPADLRLKPHLHQRPYISVVIGGVYVEMWCRKAMTCSRGTLVFHAAGEEHSDCFGSRDARVLSIDVHEAARALGMCDRLLTTRSELSMPESLLAAQLDGEFGNPCHISDLIIESLALELLANCFRRLRCARRVRTPRWLPTAVELANCGYASRLSLQDVATAVGVHPMHLARQFRRRLGCTFGEFVRRIRLRRALEKLRAGGKSIAEIASESGFADQSHFTRVFVAAMGIPPGAYRNSYRGSPARSVFYRSVVRSE